MCELLKVFHSLILIPSLTNSGHKSFIRACRRAVNRLRLTQQGGVLAKCRHPLVTMIIDKSGIDQQYENVVDRVGNKVGAMPRLP